MASQYDLRAEAQQESGFGIENALSVDGVHIPSIRKTIVKNVAL